MWNKNKKMTKQKGFDELTVLSHKSPLAWNKEDVGLWIKSLGFPEYQKLFIQHDVSGEVIFSLDIVDLKAIGVSVLGHRKKIMQEVNALGTSLKKDDSNSKSKSKSEDSQSNDSSDSTTPTSNNPNTIRASFIMGGDETKINLKKTYTFKKVQTKVASMMGVGDVKFSFQGNEITQEKDWQVIAQNNNEVKIELSRSNPNELSSIEKHVMETLVDSTFVIDTKGTILYCNNKVKKELGYTREELLGKNIKVIMPEEYASKHDGYLSNYVRTGEKHVIGKGRYIKLKLSSGDVRDAWLSITENKTTYGRHTFTGNLHLVEHQDRSSELQSFKILDCLSQAVLVINDSGMIQFMNRSSETLLAFKTETLLGQNVNLIMPEPYASRHDGYIRNYLKAGKSNIIGTTGRLVAAKSGKGSLIPILLEVSELIMEEKRFFVGVMSRQEKSVKKKTVLEEAREVINNLLVPAIIIDQEGIIQALNEDTTDLLGYELSDVVGENISCMMNDNDAKKHDGYLQKYLKTGETSVIDKKRKVIAKTKEGKLKSVILSVTEKQDSNGEKIFMGILLPSKEN
eukprot:TRINITY_DN2579_c0_g1_i1.p1 TRINITY_DN2579_c0_g1~~TRINITY_DN2579_c0_g1_i1.p1  ORF type:complete len:569 (-),score=160.27 TRINITY_DN2579_c0_g1_i1:63-1769(-)